MPATDLNPINPFPGLRPFDFEDAYLFFGREGQSDEIVRRLRLNRLLAVVGVSGSGKSSLIRAGLLPYLHGGMMASTGSRWRVAIFRPGVDPIGNMARALSSPAVLGTAEPGTDPEKTTIMLEVTLRQSSLGLIEAVRLAQVPENENLLIVVDQFEELFRFAGAGSRLQQENDATAFVKLLLEATKEPDFPIYVVLTMRSDYIGDCARFRDLPEAVTAGLYLIPRMTRDQRREAIEGPLRVVRAAVSARLVNRLLNDVGDSPDQLPILQHALMRTFSWSQSHHPQAPLDLEDYLAVGGFAEALSLHADEAYEELPGGQHQELAERIFRCLTEKGGDNREGRRPCSIATLVEVTGANIAEVIFVTNHFRAPGRSFLMPPADVPLDETSIIDISHESLIRGWVRLRKWVEEEAESAKVYRRIAETAALHAQKKAGLWDDPQDPSLQDALIWKEKQKPTPGWANRYHPGFAAAMDFLEESRKQRDWKLAELEQHRTQELRRTRRYAVAISVAFLISIALAVFSFQLWRSAVKAKDNATKAAERERKSAQDAREAQKKAEDAEQRAEQKEEEAVAWNEDLHSEAIRSQEQFIEDQQELSNLSDALIDQASPLAAVAARNTKQLVLSQMGNHAEAVNQLNAMLEADPENWSVLFSRGYEYALLGQGKKAAEDTSMYLKQNPQSSNAYLNLAIAQAMLPAPDYAAALTAVRKSIQYYNPSSFDHVFDSEVAPDIQRANGHTVLVANGSALIVALHYEPAVLCALGGGQYLRQFEVYLKDADNFALSHPRSIDPYLLALNWVWLDLRVRPEGYGGLAVSGWLWEQAAKIRPNFKSWARQDYKKFMDYHQKHHDPRYDRLAEWVSRQLNKSFTGDVPNVADAGKKSARELSLEASLQDARGSGDDLMRLAPVQKTLTDAIHEAEKDPKQNDFLVYLLLRRAKLRWRAKDLQGVRKDCLRILKIYPESAEAYYLMGFTESDPKNKRHDFEKAHDYDPASYDASKELSQLAQDPQLMEKGSHLSPGNADNYKQIAQLKLELGKKGNKQATQEALKAVNTAISMRPADQSLYELRCDIEKSLGYSKNTMMAHLVAGYREAGNAEALHGKDAQALVLWLKSLEVISARKDTDDSTLNFELERSIHDISDFIVAKSGTAEAQVFWRNFAHSNISASVRKRAEEEQQRLSTP